MSVRELGPREIIESNEYKEWHATLKDHIAIAAIARRKKRFESGNLGDSKYVGDKIYELRIDLGPGYRIYFAEINNTIILLTNGGTKHRQQNDINKAKDILSHYHKEKHI